MKMAEQVKQNTGSFDGMTLAQRMHFCHTPGLGAAWNGSAGAGELCLGEARRGSGQAVCEDTLFQAASISKPVFAAGVLRLFEQGVVDVYADVNRYLKGFQVEDEEGRAAPVTLAQLLSHSGGINVHAFPGYRKGRPLPRISEVLEGKGNTPRVLQDTVPAKRCRYSGGGYTIAQKVVEDVTGLPLPQLLEQLVLGPCGMKRSTCAQPLPEELEPKAAWGHEPEYTPVTGGFHSYPEQAAAGLWTTPADLRAFGAMVQRSLAGEGFLRPETARLMITPQLAGEHRIGLGFFVDDHTFFHTGSNEGFLCCAAFSLEGRNSAVVMGNNGSGIGVVMEAVEAIKKLAW